jgi:protein-S-isoprenylcysteine O-methyltransferase Ste14
MNQIRQFSFKEFWVCTLISVVIFFGFSPFYSNNSMLHGVLDIIGAIFVIFGATARLYTKFFFNSDRINTKGPYSVVRNPKCLTAYIAMIGLSLISARLQLMVFMPVMAGFIFIYIINRQENLLILIYGDEFREYQKNVPRLIPDFKKYKPGIPRRLSVKEFSMAMLEIGFWFGAGLLIEGLEVFGL